MDATRCYCFTSSSAKTSDSRATSTDQGRAVTGEKNIVTTDQASTLAAGDQSTIQSAGAIVENSGNISAAQGATVQVGASDSALQNLVGQLTTASGDQLAALANSLKPVIEAQADQANNENNKVLMIAALAIGAALFLRK